MIGPLKPRPEELCIICDEPTGKAGPGDGSLYDDDGHGPFCDDCYEKNERERNTPTCKADWYGDPRL